jgi:hypothetical protein
MPTRRVAGVMLEGNSLEAVRQRYEVNGWDFLELVQTQNAGPVALFSKPEGAPDYQPFFEPNVNPSQPGEGSLQE